jgi:hypothetical protein
MTIVRMLGSQFRSWTLRSSRSCSLRGSQLPVLLGLGVMGSGVLSCAGDTTTGPPPGTATQAFWQVQLNQHAINLALTAPEDTIRLTATPVTETGTPLQGVGTPTFRASDSTVTVNPLGLVTAHYITTQSLVIATLTVQGVTLTDTAFIQVTATPPANALATFSLQPAPGDSAKRGVNTRAFNWNVTATNTAGQTICSNTVACPLLVYYRSSNPYVAGIQSDLNGFVYAQDTGHVVFTATTWAYGVAMRDSVAFTEGYPAATEIGIDVSPQNGVMSISFNAPKRLILGVGAVVQFQDDSPQPVDVVFDSSAAADTASSLIINEQTFLPENVPPTGSGNIAAFGGDTSYVYITDQYDNNTDDNRARRFHVPGTYRYHSTLFPSDTSEFVIQIQQ